MNAKELADGLKKNIFSPKFLDEAEIMLRQQADRIAELEKGLEDYSGEVDDGVKFVGTLPDGHPLKMSKPVAWINRFMDDGWLSWDKDTTADVATPLYTHPHKQLSDEEILNKVWAGNFDDHHCLGFTEDEFLNCVRQIIKEITE